MIMMKKIRDLKSPNKNLFYHLIFIISIIQNLSTSFASQTDETWLDTRIDLKDLDQQTHSPIDQKNHQTNDKLNFDLISSSFSSNQSNDSTSKKSNRIENFDLNSSFTSTETSQINATLSDRSPRLYSIILDDDRLLTLFWTVNYEQKHIIFELKFNLPNQVNAPFLAFGFSSNGQFENADLCILWNDVDKNRFHFQDTWTDSNGFINLDKQNDCELLSTRRISNQIYLLFKRKFNTCDRHDFKLEKGTNHLIYALGNGHLEQVYGLRLTNLKRKGFIRTSLFKSKQIPPLLDANDVKTADFKTPKIIIPNVETTYWCSIHKLDEIFKQKQHIVRYESIIQTGNEQLVHHMELFHCEIPTDMEIPIYNGPCTGEKVPTTLSFCRRVIAAWAMGAGPISYPVEAGLAVGGKNYSFYVMQETHYNNPNLISNREDSSGMRIYYTDKLRKHDIGILEIGLEYSPKNMIPPKQNLFELQGHCVPECTRIGLPSTGINIVASQLHTHLTGVQVFTKHFREGKELDELNRDNYYSTHFQEIRLLDQPINVQPGDALVNHCVYSTKDRSNITLGGYGIKDEMCVNYLHYYPRVDLEVCKSSVDTEHLYNYFNYLKHMHNQPIHLVNDSKQLNDDEVSKSYRSIQWNSYLTKQLNDFFNQSPLSMQCNRSSGERFPGNWNGVALTPIFHRKQSVDDECTLVDQL